MAFDFKKEFKEYYLPKNKPEIISLGFEVFEQVRFPGGEPRDCCADDNSNYCGESVAGAKQPQGSEIVHSLFASASGNQIA